MSFSRLCGWFSVSIAILLARYINIPVSLKNDIGAKEKQDIVSSVSQAENALTVSSADE